VYLIISLRYGYVPFAANAQQPRGDYQFPLPPDARQVRVVEGKYENLGQLSYLTSLQARAVTTFYERELLPLGWVRAPDNRLHFELDQKEGPMCGEIIVADLTIHERPLGTTQVVIRKGMKFYCA
jgi:hypothetical protein